jgi:hypothetical protein
LRSARTRRRYLMLVPALLAALVVLKNDFFAGSAAVAGEQAERPIETGDIKRREALREALKIDAERYPFGEIECEVTKQHLEGPVCIQAAKVHSWWLNDKSFTKIQQRFTTDPSFVISRELVEGVQIEDTDMEQTVDNDKIMVVNKVATRARIQVLAKQGRMLNSSVSPADFWFGKVDGGGEDWFRVLGPHPTTGENNVKQYDAKSLPGDKLQITITLLGDQGTARAVASLKNWKVLSVDEKLKSQGKDQRFTYLYTWSEGGCPGRS